MSRTGVEMDILFSDMAYITIKDKEGSKVIALSPMDCGDLSFILGTISRMEEDITVMKSIIEKGTSP